MLACVAIGCVTAGCVAIGCVVLCQLENRNKLRIYLFIVSMFNPSSSKKYFLMDCVFKIVWNLRSTILGWMAKFIFNAIDNEQWDYWSRMSTLIVNPFIRPRIMSMVLTEITFKLSKFKVSVHLSRNLTRWWSLNDFHWFCLLWGQSVAQPSRVQDYKKVKFQGRDISSLAVKGQSGLLYFWLIVTQMSMGCSSRTDLDVKHNITMREFFSV